ncbi:MAG: hypothetical protein AAF801_18240 [Pseudomonadota bacterium]
MFALLPVIMLTSITLVGVVDYITPDLHCGFLPPPIHEADQ